MWRSGDAEPILVAAEGGRKGATERGRTDGARACGAVGRDGTRGLPRRPRYVVAAFVYDYLSIVRGF